MVRRPKKRLSQWVKSLIGSLSLSLFLFLFGLTLVAFAVFAFVNIRNTSEQWSDTVQSSALRFSELIKSSTHYGMLLNRKEDVHHIIKTIAKEPGVEGVRIYDKQGLIIFSANTREIGEQVDLLAEACVGCHNGPRPLQTVPSGKRTRIYEGTSGRILGLISPIPNVQECYSAPCHAHPRDQTVLGVLDVKMSMVEADATMASTRRQIIVAGVLTALAVGVFSAGFILQVVRRPVKQLISGTERVAAGDLDTRTDVRSRSEIGQLSLAFNRMTQDLRQAKEEVTAWSDRLEQRLQDKTEELRQTQRQVVHMEKMASLGKLAATVAHELNNPLAGILAYAKLVERTLREAEPPPVDAEEVARYLDLIHKEAGRCGEIVHNLLVFAHRSGAELRPHSLKTIIERALMIVRHHLEIADVASEVHHLETDDELVCDADQIQQALVAMFVNAVEAMPAGGTLRVASRAVGESIELRVEDTGSGIPESALPNIFEPFFSTKDDSRGVGLGLSVAYGIVQRHQGRIDVESEVGRGTAFTIRLPRRPEPSESSHPGAAEAEEVHHAG